MKVVIFIFDTEDDSLSRFEFFPTIFKQFSNTEKKTSIDITGILFTNARNRIFCQTEIKVKILLWRRRMKANYMCIWTKGKILLASHVNKTYCANLKCIYSTIIKSALDEELQKVIEHKILICSPKPTLRMKNKRRKLTYLTILGCKKTQALL